MGAERLVTLFSWVPALFGPTIMVDCWVGGLSTTEARSAVLETWSANLDGDLDPVTGVKRIGLICVRGTDEACVFWVPSWTT
jgi:hypothetical protein